MAIHRYNDKKTLQKRQEANSSDFFKYQKPPVVPIYPTFQLYASKENMEHFPSAQQNKERATKQFKFQHLQQMAADYQSNNTSPIQKKEQTQKRNKLDISSSENNTKQFKFEYLQQMAADYKNTQQNEQSETTESPIQRQVQKQSNLPNVAQLALVRDQEILDKRTNTFNWTSFRGQRDEDDTSKSATEKGRGAKLKGKAFGGGVESKINWAPVHPTSEEGTYMKATIGPDHNLGSSPSEKNALARVKAFKILSGKSYVSGHLLNEKLGGPGDDARNLTAFSGSANTLEASNIEKEVRDPVNNEGYWFIYIIQISYASDSKIYSSDDKKIKDLNNLNTSPKGVQGIRSSDGLQTKVIVSYASKLEATWYQLNDAGGRYGAEYKKDIDMNSPLTGGNATLDPQGIAKNGIVNSAFTGSGSVAKTDIDAEELVLTTGTILKSVVENREGLITVLDKLRKEEGTLKKTIETLEQQKEEGDDLASNLLDEIYQYGYDYGYQEGYNSYFYEIDIELDEPGEEGAYSDGYWDGYGEGQFDAKQYDIGSEHGSKDADRTEKDGYLYHDKDNNYSYRQGYWETAGKKHGYKAGINDDSKSYGEIEEADYIYGYDKGYENGQSESPFRKGERPVFHGISLASDLGAINVNSIYSFFGNTSVEITGNKYFKNTMWYEVKILSCSDFNLQGHINRTAWMKKKWISKGG